jgi:EpsI family protein
MSVPSRSRRLALAAIALPLIGARAAILGLEPRRMAVDELPPIDLAADIPTAIEGWSEDTRAAAQVVSPTLSNSLADSYDQTLSRVYAGGGRGVMMSLAYGRNQRRKKLHMPTGCYRAQGYKVFEHGRASFRLSPGVIPVSTFVAASPTDRRELVTYWILYGGQIASERLQGRYELFEQEASGLIPDGLLFRLSVDASDQSATQPTPQDFALLQDFTARLHARMDPAKSARYFSAATAAQS